MLLCFIQCPLHCAPRGLAVSPTDLTSTCRASVPRAPSPWSPKRARRPSVSYNRYIHCSSDSSYPPASESPSDPQSAPRLFPTSPPPPGREDEFADSNGDSLPSKEAARSGSKVGTLERDLSFDTVLQELTAIQKDSPRNVAILGTRHTSYLHQQIIELLTYANVLVGNHVFTSGAGGTNAAVIRGALRAERPDLLTVVLPQSLHKQPKETQEQLNKVQNLIQMKKNDPLPLDIASQLCNSDILSRCTHFIAFAFHDSDVVLEAVRQAKELRIVVTVLYLD